MWKAVSRSSVLFVWATVDHVVDFMEEDLLPT